MWVTRNQDQLLCTLILQTCLSFAPVLVGVAISTHAEVEGVSGDNGVESKKGEKRQEEIWAQGTGLVSGEKKQKDKNE